MTPSEGDNTLEIVVSGTTAPLDEALGRIGDAAAEAAASVNDAFSGTSGVDSLTTSTQAAASAIDNLTAPLSAVSTELEKEAGAAENAGAAADDTAKSSDNLNAVMAQLLAAVQGLSGSVDNLAESEKRLEQSSEETATGVSKLADIVEGAKEVAEAFVAVALAEKLAEVATEAVHAYGEAEQVRVSLTLMSGSAESAAEAMEKLDEMAVKLGLSQEALESSARRLSAVFGTGEGLEAVMTAAANASAATGNSFDAVAASIQRVEQTGAVSARQLVALGLSWKDLAATMGLSIEDAQAKLKKGGQEAEADVEAVLAAIKAKYGEAAAAQAQTILGQIASLKAQVVQVMQDLGSAIAPAVGSIVSLLQGTVLPIVKTMIDDFKALPEPIKAGALAVGLLAAAVIPLTAGLGVLGMALQGVDVLLERVGVHTSAMATSQTAATASAHGLAAAESEVAAASTGAASGIGALGAALPAVILGAAAIVNIGLAGDIIRTTKAINDQITAQVAWDQEWADLKAVLPGVASALEQVAAINDQIGEKTAAAKQAVNDLTGGMADSITQSKLFQSVGVQVSSALDLIASDADKVKTRLPAALLAGVGPAGSLAAGLKGISNSLSDMDQKLDLLSPKLLRLPAPPSVKQLTIDLDGASAAFQKVLETVDKSNTELDNLEKAVKLADAAYAAGNITLQQYNAVVDAFNAKLKQVNGAQKDLALSFEQIRQKVADAQTAFQLAHDSFVTTLQAYIDGKATVNDLAAAYTQAQTKAKAAGNSFYEANAAMAQAKTAADNQLTSLEHLAATYKALRDSGDNSVTGQLALAEAQKKVETAAQSLGLSLVPLGNGLDVQVADKSGKASAGLQSVATWLKGVIGPTDLVYVVINGKLVPTLLSLEQSAGKAAAAVSKTSDEMVKFRDAATGAESSIRVLKGTTDQTVGSFDAASVKVVGFGEDITTAKDLIDQVNSEALKYHNTNVELASSVDAVASATNSETTALKGLGSAIDSVAGKAGNLKNISKALASGKADTGTSELGMTSQQWNNLGMSGFNGTTMGLQEYMSMLIGMLNTPGPTWDPVAADKLLSQWAYDALPSGTMSGDTKGLAAYYASKRSGGSSSSSAAAAASALDSLTSATTTYTGTLADAQDAYDKALAAYRAGTGSLNDFLAAAQKLDQAESSAAVKLSSLSDATKTATTALTTAADTVSAAAATAAQASDAAASGAVQVAASTVAAAASVQAAAVDMVTAVTAATATAAAAASPAASGAQAMGTGALYSFNIPVSAGTVVGSNGIDSLTTMIQAKIVAGLKQVVGQKLTAG
jgi:hypothetical protein